MRSVRKTVSELFSTQPSTPPKKATLDPPISTQITTPISSSTAPYKLCPYCNTNLAIAIYLQHLDECSFQEEKAANESDGWGDEDDNAWEEAQPFALPQTELVRQSSGASSFVVDMLEPSDSAKSTIDKSKVVSAAMPTCPVCEERFPAQLFDTHFSECFARMPSNCCPMCFRRFESQNRLEKHAVKCMGIAETKKKDKTKVSSSSSSATLSPIISFHTSSSSSPSSSSSCSCSCSSAVSQVVSGSQCPLCFTEFPDAELMMHASYCQGPSKTTSGLGMVQMARDEALAKALQQQEDETKRAEAPFKEYVPGAGPRPLPQTTYRPINIRTAYPNSQSWRGIPDALRSTATSQTPYANDCFRRMLERENELCDNFFVFYHSYSFIAVCYEVQACLARTIYGLPHDFAPLPRLLKAPFDGKPCLDLLLAEFSSMSGQDHNPAFRAMAISANTTLFSNDEGAPIQSFLMGYSCTDLNFRSVLADILTACGAPSTSSVDHMIDNIAQLCVQYHLDASGITKNSRAGVVTAGSNKGHMVQLFVHKSIVDDLAYASKPMGILDNSRMPLSQYLPKQAVGQARIFMHPTLFCDVDCARIFHYPANPAFAYNRVQFQKELQLLLEPILGSEAGMLKAFRGIEGIKPGGELDKAALVRFYGSRQAAQTVNEWKETLAAAKNDPTHPSAAQEWKNARQQAYGMMKAKALSTHKDKVENAHAAALTIQRREELDRMMAEALTNPTSGRAVQAKYEPPTELMLKFGKEEKVTRVPVTATMKISELAELVSGIFGKHSSSLKLVFEGKTFWRSGVLKGPETLVEHRIPHKAKIHVLS